MKHFYLLAIYFLLSISLLAQQPQWQWANRGGSASQSGSEEEYADDIEVDAQGNTYVTGRIYASANFGHTYGSPFVPSYGMMDIFLAKYDCSGNQVWLNILGSNTNDYPNGLEIGNDEMIYLFGTAGDNVFNIKTDSATTAQNFSNGRVFISKFNSNGALVKFKKFDQTITGNLKLRNLLKKKENGNLTFLCSTYPGWFSANIIVSDTGTVLVEVDTGLNALRVKTIIKSYSPFSIFQYLSVYSIIADTYNNVFLIGNFAGTFYVDGNPIQSDSGSIGVSLVVKLDTTGNYIWHNQGSSITSSGVHNGDVTSNNDIVVWGGGRKNISLLGHIISYTGNSVAMLAFARLNGNNGSLIWGKNGNSDYFFGDDKGELEVRNEQIYFTNDVTDSVILDNTLIKSEQGKNGYLLNMNSDYSNNMVNWLYQMNTYTGTQYNYSPYALALTEQGTIYMCGTFSGSIYTASDTIFFANGTGTTDMFVAKYGLPCNDTTPLIAPLAPSQLIATATASNAITVTWTDNSQYEQLFRIYRSLDSINYFIYDSVPANVTTYIDLGVLQNTVYWYKAAAVNNIGASNFTNADSAIIIPTAIPEIENNIQLIVQPNPNNGNFTLIAAADQTSNALLTITGLDGRQILSQQVQLNSGNNWYQLNLENISAGIYVVCISPSPSVKVSERRMRFSRKKFIVR